MHIHAWTSIDKEAWEMERLLIEVYRENGACLVNLASGGEGAFTVSDETRQKISKARKASKGKYKFTKQHSQNMSKAQKGKPNRNPDGWRNLNLKRRGVPLSEKHKEKISEANKGKSRQFSIEGRQNIIEAARKRWEDPAYRAKMRQNCVKGGKAALPLAQAERARRRAENYKKVVPLKEQGLSHNQIAKILGLSKTYVGDLLKVGPIHIPES